MAKQTLYLKSPLIDVNDKWNEFFSSFSFFNEEFKLGSQLTDLFPDYFSFHSHLFCVKKHIKKLDEIAFRASSNPTLTVVVSDTSIKNHIAILISHIYSFNKPVVKIIHRAINIAITKAELFAIQCSINQAVTNFNTNHIVVITNSLHATRRIFNSLVHPYQIHSATISQKLREFFSKDTRNYIEFWNCFSKKQWPLYYTMDKETKNMVFILLFLYKLSWNFCRKSKCNLIFSQWECSFKQLILKRDSFLTYLMTI